MPYNNWPLKKLKIITYLEVSGKRSKWLFDCKTVGFFLKISKEMWRKSLTRASLTARVYLNTQKYGLFCSVNGCRF